MKDHRYLDIIIKAKEVARRGKYDKAVVFLSEIPDSYNWHCSELIFKASIIQLSDKQNIYSLEDAEKSLSEALVIDPNNIEALVEMGYYQTNVNDDERAGKRFLKKAEKLCVQYLNEIKKELNEIETGLVDIEESNPKTKNKKSKDRK
jgi:hypothetical protein